MKREPNDDVGDAVDDRLDEARDVLRVVLEVGVLDDDDVAGREREARAQRRALAHVLGLQVNAHLVAAALSLGFGSQAVEPLVGELGEQLAAAVGRPVVDEDELLVEVDGDDALRRGP